LGIPKTLREDGKIHELAFLLSKSVITDLSHFLRYVAVWMGIRQVGPLLGGAISLALNANTAHVGKVGYNTYLGLIAISCCGAPLALLLSHPEKVIRTDGTKVPYMRKTSVSIEARAIWKQMKSPYMMLLVPVFLAGQFGSTYQGNYLTSKYSAFAFSHVI